MIRDVTASQAYVYMIAMIKDNDRPLTDIFNTIMYPPTSVNVKPMKT